MSASCQCPHCGAVLADKPFPVESIAAGWYSANEDGTCRYGCGRPAHGSRLIGIYSTALDRTVEWMCPDCGTRWDRDFSSTAAAVDGTGRCGDGGPAPTRVSPFADGPPPTGLATPSPDSPHGQGTA